MLEYALLIFGSLFAVVDPFAALPTFVAITAGDSAAQRIRMARTACLTATAIVLGFALAGPYLFRIFSITLEAFQVAGGLILLLAALDMLRARRSPLTETPEEVAEGMRKQDIAITPLAVPLLGGPGAITTAMVLAGRAQSPVDYAVFVGAVVAVGLACFAVLAIGASGAHRLSPTVLNVVTRLMGLLLAAIGVQFILSALRLA